MKKIIFLVAFFFVLTIGWAQDLSVIKNGQDYLLVKNQKTEVIKTDSAQLKVLTTIIISKEKIVLDTIISNIDNLKLLEKIVVANYDKLKNQKQLLVDSAYNTYGLKFWQKERIKKSFSINQEKHAITVAINQQERHIMINFEYLVLILIMIYLLYISLNNKKSKKYLQLIMAIGLMLITTINWSGASLMDNIIFIILMPLILGVLFFGLTRHILNITEEFSVIIIMSFFSGFISRSINYLFLTFGIAVIIIIILILLEKIKKPGTS